MRSTRANSVRSCSTISAPASGSRPSDVTSARTTRSARTHTVTRASTKPWSRRGRHRPQANGPRPAAAATSSVAVMGASARPADPLVAGAEHRLDHRVLLAQLLSQASHVNVDGSRLAYVVVAPYLAQQLFARQ